MLIFCLPNFLSITQNNFILKHEKRLKHLKTFKAFKHLKQLEATI
jgi:hypothetical protein